MNNQNTTNEQQISRKSEVFQFRPPAIGKRTGRQIKKRNSQYFLYWQQSTEQEEQLIIPKESDSLSFSEIKRAEEINDSRSVVSRSSRRHHRTSEKKQTNKQEKDTAKQDTEVEKKEKQVKKNDSPIQSIENKDELLNLQLKPEQKQKQPVNLQIIQNQEQKPKVTQKQQQKAEKQFQADRRITTRSTSHQFQYILPPELRNLQYQPTETETFAQKRVSILKSKRQKSTNQQPEDYMPQRANTIPMDINIKVQQVHDRRSNKGDIYSKSDAKHNKPQQHRKTKPKISKPQDQQQSQPHYKKRKVENQEQIKIQHETVSQNLSRNLRPKRYVGKPCPFFAGGKTIYNQKGEAINRCIPTSTFLQVLGFDNIKQIKNGRLASYSSNSMEHKLFITPHQKLISVGIDQAKLLTQLVIFKNFDKIVISSHNGKPSKDVEVKIDNFPQQKLQQQIVVERQRKERIQIQNVSDRKAQISITIHRPAKQ